MDTIVHSLSDGRRITVRIRRNARKNIILRPMAADAVSATIPPWLGRRQLAAWLSEREDLLLSVLLRAAVLPVEESLPSKLWLHGEQLDLVSGGHEGVLLLPSRVSVAEAGEEEQKELLRKEWRRRAAETLLPRLVGHAGRWNSNLRQWLCRMPKLSGAFAAAPRGYASTGGWSAHPILWWIMFACMSFAIFRIRTTAAIFGVWSIGIRRTRRQPSCG